MHTDQQQHKVQKSAVPFLTDREESWQSDRFINDDASDTKSHSSSISSLPALSRNSTNLAIVLYSITTVFLFSDQNLLSPNLTAIANEFNFTALERDQKLGGEISLAFFLLAAPASVLVGALADRYPHRRSLLFASCVFLGEGSCLCTYFTKDYTGLFVTRVLTGFSIGGALPVLLTLVGDYFPADQRAKATSYLNIGSGMGVSIGQGISGFVGPKYGWRAPFLIVSIPALVLAVLVVLFVKDPVRGGMEKAVLQSKRERHVPAQLHMDPSHTGNGCAELGGDDVENLYHRTTLKKSKNSGLDSDTISEDNCRKKDSLFEFGSKSSTCSTICILLRVPSVVFLLLQGTPGCVPWGIINTYLNDYLAEEGGMSVETATIIILIFGMGVFFGIFSSGIIGSYLYSKYGPRYPPLFGGLSVITAIFPLYILINTVSSSTPFHVTFAICITAGAFAGMAGTIVKSTLMNVTHPYCRGTVFSLHIVFDDVGKGLGPLFVAGLISAFDGNRKHAFNAGLLGWFLCGSMIAIVFLFAEKDEENVQRSLLTEHGYEESKATSDMEEKGDGIEMVERNII